MNGRASFVADDGECESFHRSARGRRTPRRSCLESYRWDEVPRKRSKNPIENQEAGRTGHCPGTAGYWISPKQGTATAVPSPSKEASMMPDRIGRENPAR
jgi:hypothetical protein